jgi:polyisoprenoid-binding protein YceI
MLRLVSSLTLAPVALLLCSLPVQALTYTTVQPARSQLTFTYKQMGVPVQGKFGKFATQLAFDPAQPAAARITVQIDTTRIDAGSTEASDEIVGKAWFNSKAFPVATFTASNFQALGGGRFQAPGQLTLKGKTRPITLPFTLKADASGGSFSGSFILRRSDFQIGEGEWATFDIVSNDVVVQFQLLATPQ